jgi:hypothetical protein
LQHDLPALLENVPLQTRRQTYYQHEGAPPHFIQVVRQYLNLKVPNRWIGRSGAQNWPPRSLDLNPLYYHVRGYRKAVVYEHKMNTRKELLQRILNAARSINNASEVYKFSGHTSQKMYPSRWRTLRTTCLSVERRICNSTMKNISQ